MFDVTLSLHFVRDFQGKFTENLKKKDFRKHILFCKLCGNISITFMLESEKQIYRNFKSFL